MALPAEGLTDQQPFRGQWYQRHGQAASLEELEQFAEEVSRASGLGGAEAGVPTLDARGGCPGSGTPGACARTAKFMNQRPPPVTATTGGRRRAKVMK